MKLGIRFSTRRLLPAAVIVFALAVVGVAAAAKAPPKVPADSGVQQYIETIPTATGGTPSGGSSTGGTSGGTSGVTSGGAQPAPATSSPKGTGAKGGSKATGGSTANPGTGSTATTGRSTSTADPITAAVRAGSSGGMSRGGLLAIILGAITLCVLAAWALRRRARRTL